MEALIQMEGTVLLWIQEYLRNDFLDPIVKFITHSGDHGYLWIALLLVLLSIPKTRRAALIGAATLLLTFIITNLCLKPMIARVRPYEVVEGLTRIIEKQSDRSFPSGHTAASFAVSFVMFRYLPKKIGVPAVVLSALIALSRLYLGVHYPSDVIMGLLIAMVVSTLTIRIAKRREQRTAYRSA